MSQPLVYAKNGRYYDLIYGWKDYKKESKILEGVITQFKTSKGNQLLDIGCGTGEHLKFMSKSFVCTGLDINKNLLKIASKKNKALSFVHADMLNFQLDKKFDVITCLFSSIGYVQTLENLNKTLINCFNHLNSGGVLIIEPWFAKNSKGFKVDVPYLTIFEGDDIKIARLSVAKILENLSIMDTHYLVAESGGVVKHFSEKHILGLFEKKDILSVMKNVGFSTRFLDKDLSDDGRGLYIGTK